MCVCVCISNWDKYQQNYLSNISHLLKTISANKINDQGKLDIIVFVYYYIGI